MGPTEGHYILQLCMGPSYFWRGPTPPGRPLFRTLAKSIQNKNLTLKTEIFFYTLLIWLAYRNAVRCLLGDLICSIDYRTELSPEFIAGLPQRLYLFELDD